MNLNPRDTISLYLWAPSIRFGLLLASILLGPAAWSQAIFQDGFEQPTVNGSGQTPESTLVIENAAQSGVVLTVSGSGDLIIDAPSGGVGGQFQTGRTVQILPGNDTDIPLGLAGEIESTGSAGVSTTAVLTPSTLVDVFDVIDAPDSTIPLTAESFLGVVVPAAVQPSANAKRRMQSGIDGLVELGGGLWLPSGTARQGAAKGGSNIDVGLGDIVLDLEIELADIINDPTRIRPYGSGAEAVVAMQLSLTDVRLRTSIDFDALSLGGPRLNSFDLSVEATLEGQLALSGGVEATMGFYSQAWNEVEDAGFNGFKLKGLSSNDKIGRYPIAGLVFSLPCPVPAGCPIMPGTTQTPLRAAKAGGVILWVYANLDGMLTLDGSIGARLSATRTIFAASKSATGGLDLVSSAEPVIPQQSPTQLEAPFIDGELGLSGDAGFALDADLFLFGVRLANVATDIGLGFNAAAEGTLAFATPQLSSPMVWGGSGCINGSAGGGAIFSASMGIGIEVPTLWPSVGLNYSIQFPTDDEILQPGLHGLWYTAVAGSSCYPAQVNGSLNDTGQDWCANNSVGYLICPQGSFPDQDGDHGRDALARTGSLTKAGGGEAGFDYTKISNSGNPLPASATLGAGVADWGCTRDNVTGLVWEVKLDNPTSLRHKDHTYSWYDTDFAINGGNAGSLGTTGACNGTLPQCNTSAFVAAVNAEGLCGASDWRIPTPEELQGILHYGRLRPLIDPVYFPNPGSVGNAFGSWSGRNYAANASLAWYVDFGSGRVWPDPISKSGYIGVRLVRAGP